MKKQSFLMEIITLGVVMGVIGCSNPETNTAGGSGDSPEDILEVSLVASAGELNPAFDEAVLNYTLVVNNDRTTVEFSFAKDGEAEQIEVSGADSLNEGANAVTVTLASGTVYNITVIRLPSVRLSKITVSANDFQSAPIALENPGEVVSQTLPYHVSPPAVTVKFEASQPAVSNAVITMTGSIGGVAVSGGQIAGVAILLGETQTGNVETSVSFDVNGTKYSAKKTYKVTLARPDFQPVATGGQIEKITADDGTVYEVHTFTSDDSFAAVASQTLAGRTVDVLVVGGGGGGGGGTTGVLNGRRGAGGGAGRFVYETNYLLAEETIDIVIGEGGEGSTGDNFASKGGDSSFGTLTAIGGGAGGTHHALTQNPDRDGGSGGGKAKSDYLTPIAGVALPGIGMGNNGGTCPHLNYCAAGGGGAGAPGGNVTAVNTGSTGGDGLECDISGEALWYAGGGGSGGAMDGGKGGGGKGGVYNKTSAEGGTNGEAGTGGGGGGGITKQIGDVWYSGGGNGGSGIVIVRIPL